MADEDLGTTEATEQVDQTTETVETDTTAAAAGTTEQAADKAKPATESFINPADLPEEIKPHWSRMHRAYTKALDGVKARKGDLDFLDQYRSNPEIAKQVLQQEAARLGLTLAPANTPAKTENPDGPPPEVVERVRARLAPELQWAAEQFAAAQWDIVQHANRPLLKQSEEQQQREAARLKAEQETQFRTVAEKLTEIAPGWEEKSDEISEWMAWMQGSGPVVHPVYGSRLAVAYNAVTNGGAAKAAAIRDMATAARNATRTGQSTRTTVTNITERVMKARTNSEAAKIAAEEAERELRSRGIAVPD